MKLHHHLIAIGAGLLAGWVFADTLKTWPGFSSINSAVNNGN